jgi:hypothetical protein
MMKWITLLNWKLHRLQNLNSKSKELFVFPSDNNNLILVILKARLNGTGRDEMFIV